MVSRRELIVALAASVAACVTGDRRAGPLRLTLLGQALITHDLCRQAWPALPACRRLARAAMCVFTDLEWHPRPRRARAPRP